MRLLPDSELYLKTPHKVCRRQSCKPKKSPAMKIPARFEVEVEKIYTLVATNAQEERITLTIRGKNQSVSFDMKLSKSISAISAFRIFCDLARANIIFQQYISEVYELSYETLAHETVYRNALRQYYSGNDENCQSDYEPVALIDWGGSLLEIANLENTLIWVIR